MTTREARRLSLEEIDSQNAMWFAWHQTEHLRYGSPRGRWYLCDGDRWARCSENDLRRRALQTAQSIACAARDASEYKRRESLRQMASRLQLPEGLHRMVAFARFNRAIQTDLFIEAEVADLRGVAERTVAA